MKQSQDISTILSKIVELRDEMSRTSSDWGEKFILKVEKMYGKEAAGFAHMAVHY